jgi:hypothetical protein
MGIREDKARITGDVTGDLNGVGSAAATASELSSAPA